MVYELSEQTKGGLVIRYQYDANASIKNLLHIHGTALELVLTKPLFWALLLLHYMLFFLKKHHDCKEISAPDPCYTADWIFKQYPLQISDLGMLTSLTTFFLVFYNGNCFGRYGSMYSATIAIQGRMHNIGVYLRSYYTQSATRWNVIRYLLASHYIFYWSLKRRYFDWKNSQYIHSDPGSFQDLIKNVLLPKGVLIKVEAEKISKYAGNKHKLLFTWSIIALKRIMQANVPKGEKGNPMLASEFEQTSLITNVKKEIIAIRGAIGSIDNSMLFPIPFQYYHMVNLTLNIHMVLLAYAFLFINGKEGSHMSLLAYPLVVFVLMGLREVANAMADPFGKDECDFNQDAIQEGIYKECKRICEEPEEEFLAQLGDPSFNPTRNADGSLAEPEPGKEPPPPAEPEVKEIMWAQSDVQAVLDEKAELEAELRRGGTKELAEAVKAMAEVFYKVPEELREQNRIAHERLNRLEQLILEKLPGALQAPAPMEKGDSFERRYHTKSARPAVASVGKTGPPAVAPIAEHHSDAAEAELIPAPEPPVMSTDPVFSKEMSRARSVFSQQQSPQQQQRPQPSIPPRTTNNRGGEGQDPSLV